MKTIMTAACVAMLAVLAGSAWAQGAAAEKGDGELAARQQFTREKFQALKARMLRVADLLEKTEPESAAAIRQAVNEAQRAFIDQDMEKVIQYLLRGLPSNAARTEIEVIKELREVLETLRRGIMDLDERYQRIQEWKALAAKIDEILKQQKALEAKSRLAMQADRMAERLEKLGAEMEAIVREQKELLQQTGGQAGDEDLRKLSTARDAVRDLIARQEKLADAVKGAPVGGLPVAAEAQKKLSGEAGKLAEDLSKLAKDTAVAAKLAQAGADGKSISTAAANTATARGEMDKAGAALDNLDPARAGRSQEQALADLKAAEKALSGALSKASAGTAAAGLGEKQSQLSKRTSELAKQVTQAAGEAGLDADPARLDKASGEMDRAADKLGGQDPKTATEHQKNALKQLEDEKYKLADLSRRILEKASEPAQKDAPEQKDLSERTAQVGEQMKPRENKPAAPGQASVSSAAGAMSEASGKLGEGKSGDANSSQNRAIEDLKKARRDLEDALAQEQEMAQAEALAKIDAMLERILKTQQGLSSQTKETFAKRPPDGEYARAEQIKLKELSDGEGRLRDDAAKVLEMLRKEGSTVVFPVVLEQVGKDLASVQDLLARREAGKLTQAMQQEIEKSLQELIDSIRKELSTRRKKNQGGGGGPGGGGGGGGGPLVQMDAELRMLRSMQLLVNSRTKTLDASKAENTAAPADLAAQHRELAERQQTLRKMAEAMVEKMKASAGAGGR
ncbi:MAG TPA: DUF4175 family protein [Phycisphaerae bacterium]|nr:DUF4175 family protein [Phycisphaerae bacterium]